MVNDKIDLVYLYINLKNPGVIKAIKEQEKRAQEKNIDNRYKKPKSF